MTPQEAEDYAARTLAEIAYWENREGENTPVHTANRERVASDLAGLRECYLDEAGSLRLKHRTHAVRYLDGLRRTGALYGVTP